MSQKPSFKLVTAGYDAEARQLVYADRTGDYDATDKPGGYGGPNDARSAYGLFVVPQRRETAQRVTLNTAAAAPLTATEFRCLPEADGWVQTALYAVPVGNASQAPPAFALPVPVVIPPGPPPALAPLAAPPSTAYQRVDVPTDLFVYDAQAGLNRRYAYLAPDNTTTVFWKPVGAVELVGSPYLESSTDELVTADSRLLRAQLNGAVILLGPLVAANDPDLPQEARLRYVFDLVRGLLEAAECQWQMGNSYAAQQSIESIQKSQTQSLLAP